MGVASRGREPETPTFSADSVEPSDPVDRAGLLVGGSLVGVEAAPLPHGPVGSPGPVVAAVGLAGVAALALVLAPAWPTSA